MKLAVIACPTFFANVWPSSSCFWRWPSMRWPNTSWKNTPAALPSRIAGPRYGSATGAARSASRSAITRGDVERLEAMQLHAVVGLRRRLDRDAYVRLGQLVARAVGARVVARLR